MDTPQSNSPRQRLQELLAIPDRQRTDEQWDELNDLEIRLASGNREDASDPGARRNGPQSGNQPKPGGGGGGGNPQPQGRRPFKKFHKRPPKGNPG